MKTKTFRLGKGINQYQRTYYKETGVLIGLTMCFVVMMQGYADWGDETYVAEPEIVATSTPVDFEAKIRQHFPKSHKTMIAIAKAESGLSMNATGYNCYYNEDETIAYSSKVKGSHSAACHKEHRRYSYSVDCFLLQRNYIGLTECPKNVTIDQHLKEVARLSKVQGFQAWYAYQNKSYLKYLTQN